MSTSSPRWDSRNQGFVPPTQLRKNRPSVPLDMNSKQQGQLEARPSSHTRTSSFFSFTSKKSAQQQAQQAMQVAQQRSGPSSPTSPSTSGHAQSPSSTSSAKRPSLGGGPLPTTTSPAVQREIKSVVDLALAHAHKIYFSGPLVRRIERLPDGNRPTRDDGWVDVWAQLGGTTLSVWDMKAIEEASKRGEEVPPSYINVTDSFIQVLGALTSVATATAPAKRYTNVITLNTAGSNLILFACPSAPALVSWASGLRLAAWEKSRLEEMYTGHLLRMTLNEGDPWREPATTLVRGRLEGQVKVRVAGQTDWKPLWMVLSSTSDPMNTGSGPRPTSPTSVRSKKRMSNLFSRAQSPTPTGPALPTISFYASQKPKDRKRPLLTMRYVSQAFAVYPERPEIIQRSTLIKIEGVLGDEEMAGGLRGKECWLMLMPETEQSYPVFELLKWLVAFHDAYSLYGRPGGYIWDPRHPRSMWFAYPVGPQRAQLFLDRELAETLDPRDDRTSMIRKSLKQILIDRMYGNSPPPVPGAPQLDRATSQQRGSPGLTPGPSGAPVLPPIQSMGSDTGHSAPTPQLPPLDFNGVQQHQQQQQSGSVPSMSRGASSLTPITERSPVETHRSDSISQSQRGSSSIPPQRALSSSPPPLSKVTRLPPERQGSQGSVGALNEPSVKSLPEESQSTVIAESHNNFNMRRGSQSSYSGSRPDSKLEKSASFDASTGLDHIAGRAPPEGKSAITHSPSDGRSPSDRRSPSGGRSPAAVQSHYSPSSPANPPFGVTSTLSSSLSPSRSQGSLPPPVSRNQSPAPGSFHSPLALSNTPPPMASEQHQDRPSPPLQIQTVANATMPSAPSPQPLTSSSKPPSPPPKSDTLTTPAILKREWPQPPQRTGVPPLPSTLASDQVHDLANEAGALYLLHQRAEEGPGPSRLPQNPWASDEDEEDEPEDELEDDDSGPERNPPPRRGGTPPVRIQTPLAYQQVEPEAVVSESQISSHAAALGRSNLGRKPSGARAKPSHNPRRYPDLPSSLDPVSEPRAGPSSPPARTMDHSRSQNSSGYDDNADALAALTFLESQDEPAPPPPKPPIPPMPIEKPEDPSPPTSEGHQFPSSFALSKHAAERKAKAQAQQEASYAATHLPGKPNGNAKKKKESGAWAESSDEEEEDEDDEDDEDGSDDGAPVQVRQPQPVHPSDPRASVYPSAQPGPQGAASFTGDGYGQRQARTLPQPPGRTGGSPHDYQNPHGRGAPSQYDDRPRTHLGDEPRGHTINPHQAARQSVWSTVLDPRPPSRNTGGRDTFVQVDQNETMTKAFQPQGLLSAGLQDKEDRSAKRQEELARETGASLINVPNKPPPPQTGLLGAITAHERERKREGGVGAALTEKERERRLAEERQRKLDELQRMQIDQLSQGGGPGGSPYDPYGGQQQFPGFGQPFDPRMSMNPMMLNPYMSGFPMMPFGNPQQMMAAQMAAQQAYQQAMMTFSQAGSQAGDNVSRVGGHSPMASSPGMGPPSPGMAGTPSQMQGGMMGTPSPMGTPLPMQGGMMGMDPRMSMMSPMGMMGGMGMNPMMGMGMGQNFDPRMSMQQNYLQRPDSGQGRQPSYHGTPSPRQGSPAPPHSGNDSPRPHT